MAPVPTTNATKGSSGAGVQADAPGFTMPSIVRYDSLDEERKGRKERLAAAYRVFGMLGFDEGIAGHLTYRDPIEKDSFWLAPFGLSFDAVKASDLLLIGPNGDVTAGGREDDPQSRVYNRAAFAIHHAIHTARPDIDAACHSHSIHGKAFSTLGRNIDITTQDSCLFYNDIAHYDSFGGVVLADEEGRNIARALGGSKHAAILTNHGILTCGATIEGAVFRFVALEKHCQVMLLADAAAAARGAKPLVVGDEEAAFTHKQIASEQAVHYQARPYFDRAIRAGKGEHAL